CVCFLCVSRTRIIFCFFFFFFFQAEDGIRDGHVTGVQTCALPISSHLRFSSSQSTRAGGMGPSQPTAQPVDSAPTCSASLSRQALRRHSSSVRAVCVNAHVRICAGGDQ